MKKPLEEGMCIEIHVLHKLDREYNIMGRATFIDLAGSERLKHTNSKGKVGLCWRRYFTWLFFSGAHRDRSH